jgi:L-fuculose-phosphate aldolase
MWLAVELETLARQYYLTLAIGGPNILPEDEIAHVIQRFREYGPRGKTAPAAKGPAIKGKAGKPVKNRRKTA